MRKEFQYKKSAIHYSIEGNGTPLILIHGFGEDGSVFDEQVAFLKAHFLVLVPDLPGSGASDLLQGDDVSLEDYADCIYALIQHENIGPCVMLGHSMGGYITLAFGEKYKDKLLGFGLIHSTAFADNAEKKQSRMKGIEVIKEYGAFPFLKTTIPNLFSAAFKKDHREAMDVFIEKSKEFSTNALVQYYAAMMNRQDRTKVLKNSSVPVLFVIGTEDVAAPLNDLLQQVHLPNTSHIEILEGVAHMGMLEAPSIINQHILQFVSMTT